MENGEKCIERKVSLHYPNLYPPKLPNYLWNISGLLTSNGIMEKIICELLVSDIMENLDPAQYPNQQKVSLQHYLIKMINVILSDTDNSKKGEAYAIRASYWEEASSLQDNVHSWELNLSLNVV